MKVCTKCNNKLDDNTKFCDNCGEEFISKERDKEKNIEGLGGWLILVGIGVVLSPLRLLAFFAQTYLPIFKNGTWEALTSPSSEAYNSAFSTLLISEIIFNLFILIASLYLIYLFFTKNSFFPKLYILLIVISLIFIPLDAIVTSSIFPDVQAFDAETMKELIRTIIAAIIWIPYMLISKRVKATFIN